MFTIEDLDLVFNLRQYCQNKRLRTKIIDKIFTDGFKQLEGLNADDMPTFMNSMIIASKEYFDKINDKLSKSRKFNEVVKREFKEHLDYSDQIPFYDKASGLDFDIHECPTVIKELNRKKDKEELDLINGTWLLLNFLNYINSLKEDEDEIEGDQ